MINDIQSRRNRLHKGDIFQNYNGEPTLLGILCGMIIIGMLIGSYFFIKEINEPITPTLEGVMYRNDAQQFNQY